MTTFPETAAPPMPADAASRWTVYESPLGPLTLVAGPRGLRAIHFPGGSAPPANRKTSDDGALAEAMGQLRQYFAGERTRFELPLDLTGTEFQRRVWAELAAIPYGATRSYGEIAGALGRRERVRAVGAAVGRTPVPIVVPCHRVVGAGGELVGYAGGLQRKQSLLDLEAAVSGSEPISGLWKGRQLTLG